MGQHLLQVDVFRLNKVSAVDLFSADGREIRTDDEISAVMHQATERRFDIDDIGAKNQFRWSLKDFRRHKNDTLYETPRKSAQSFCLVREQLHHFGLVVKGGRIAKDFSASVPPVAIAIRVVFDPDRHLFLCEHNSVLMQSSRWKTRMQEILDRACEQMKYRTRFRFEPVPQSNEVLDAFNSFERLMRLKVRLRLPNPEISRNAQKIYDEMKAGSIDDWLSEMQAVQGLNRSEGQLPHSIASLAQAGYKDGGVELSGYRNGQRDTVVTGETALRVPLPSAAGAFSGSETESGGTALDLAVFSAIQSVDSKYPADDTQ